MNSGELLLKALQGIPAIGEGDDLAQVTLSGLERSHERLRESDVLVFAQKIVSKAEGRNVALSRITPSGRAHALAKETGKDARLVELILSESSEVVRRRRDLLIVRQCRNRRLECGWRGPRLAATGRSRRVGRWNPDKFACTHRHR
jgi:coenzyme F420-0:L-glutamate ligase/coenzyme F420-1:gamma-L-glutamate ligase